MPELAYVDREFVPLSEARVSVQDRGFLFADGIYEVFMAYSGRLFRWEAHMRRLRASAEAIRLALPVTPERMREIAEEGVVRSGFRDTQVYLQLTRGAARRTHAFPKGVTPTLVMIFSPRTEIPAELRQQGVSVVTCEEVRWSRCHIKSTALLPNVLAREEAGQRGAYEALFVTREGVVHEGTSSNLFLVDRDRLWTPPITENILQGVTRELVLECARASGLPVREEEVRLSELREADEVFLSGTTTEILGVVRVDGEPIGSGSVGPVTKRLAEQFQQEIRSPALP